MNTAWLHITSRQFCRGPRSLCDAGRLAVDSPSTAGTSGALVSPDPKIHEKEKPPRAARLPAIWLSVWGGVACPQASLLGKDLQNWRALDLPASHFGGSLRSLASLWVWHCLIAPQACTAWMSHPRASAHSTLWPCPGCSDLAVGLAPPHSLPGLHSILSRLGHHCTPSPVHQLRSLASLWVWQRLIASQPCMACLVPAHARCPRASPGV